MIKHQKKKKVTGQNPYKLNHTYLQYLNIVLAIIFDRMEEINVFCLLWCEGCSNTKENGLDYKGLVAITINMVVPNSVFNVYAPRGKIIFPPSLSKKKILS